MKEGSFWRRRWKSDEQYRRKGVLGTCWGYRILASLRFLHSMAYEIGKLLFIQTGWYFRDHPELMKFVQSLEFENFHFTWEVPLYVKEHWEVRWSIIRCPLAVAIWSMIPCPFGGVSLVTLVDIHTQKSCFDNFCCTKGWNGSIPRMQHKYWKWSQQRLTCIH